MSDLLAQLEHKLYTPRVDYQDSYERLKNTASKMANSFTVAKVAAIALPLLSNVGGDFGRGVNNFAGLIQLGYDVYDLGQVIKNQRHELLATSVTRCALSILSVSVMFFGFKIAQLLSSTINIFVIIGDLYEAIKQNDLQAILLTCARLLQSIGYLALICYGGVELGIALAAFELAMKLVHAYIAFSKYDVCQGISELIQGTIKANSLTRQIELLNSQNTFRKLQKFQNLLQRLSKVKNLSHFSKEHPLMDLKNTINNRQAFLDDKKTMAVGSHFFGLGKDVAKGMNLEFQNLKNDPSRLKLDFSINHAKRDELFSVIKELQSISGDEFKDLFEIFDLKCSDIIISHKQGLFNEAYLPAERMENVYKAQKPDILKTFDMERFYSSERYQREVLDAWEQYQRHNDDRDIFSFVEVQFKGIGSLRIGSGDEYWTMRTHVQVFLEPDQNLYDLHTALCLVGLDQVLERSSDQDIERMKLGHLFRMFEPNIAHKFEISEKFFDLSIDELKKEIIQLAPSMEGVIDKYLSRMQAYEILPGKCRFQIVGLKDELISQGALGLTASISLNYDQSGHLDFTTIASILKHGMLSNEQRSLHDLILTAGLSPSFDKQTGGSDSIFTQLVTNGAKSYSLFSYQSEVRLLIDLEACETGTYQYSSDCFGNRRRDSEGMNTYDYAEGILDFVKRQYQEQSLNRLYNSNELMIKERLRSEWIRGLVVQSEIAKNQLIQTLQKQNLITTNESGQKMISGVKLDEFIHVGNKVINSHF